MPIVAPIDDHAARAASNGRRMAAMIAVGDPLGARERAGVLQQHGELVAAEARRGVGVARARDEALGDRAQQLVARRVADAVVDGLEAVEVDEQHREVAAAAGAALERVLEAVEEERGGWAGR